MVSTRNTGDEAAFNAAVNQAVEAFMPDLRTRLFEEYRQAHLAAGSSGDAAPTPLGWLEKFGKQKPKSFSSANSPVDAENWIAHIEKIFDSFREIFYLQYFPRSEQQKFEREYHNIKQFDNESSGDFMRRFLHLASFLGTRAGNQEEQAMKFKWALSDWILESLVNTDFTDIAKVADAARNVEILMERTRSNKRNRDGDRIQSYGATGSGQVQRSQGQRDQDRRGNGNGNGGSNRYGDRNNNQKHGNNRGQQYGNSSGLDIAPKIINDLELLEVEFCSSGRDGYWASLKIEPNLILRVKEAQKDDGELWSIIQNLEEGVQGGEDSLRDGSSK
ncbi:hypothetical protein CTI12_AA461840 [Artemisia annua]|uniref:Retrotransposon gag domain-containing protein n=1 Tax=Artemisia annua TaxID=35608 RepID=A0A2U1LQ45_ARTAN|nr:hypothetical protein CTI12_AA461840 [Artemisia annua]